MSKTHFTHGSRVDQASRGEGDADNTAVVFVYLACYVVASFQVVELLGDGGRGDVELGANFGDSCANAGFAGYSHDDVKDHDFGVGDAFDGGLAPAETAEA